MLHHIEKELLLFALFTFTLSPAQEYSPAEWAAIDKILYPHHIPVISSEKIRYVPKETRMEFDQKVVVSMLGEVIKVKEETGARLASKFEEYLSSFSSCADQINKATIRKDKLRSSLSPWYSFSHLFDWISDYYAQWQSNRLRHQVNRDVEEHATYLRAYLQHEDVLHDLEKAKKATLNNGSLVSLSGREFAYCAQQYAYDHNQLWYLPCRKNKQLLGCFEILDYYKDRYNERGEYYPDKDRWRCMDISYRPFHGMGTSHENYSDEKLFLLPYIKKNASDATAYDGYGSDQVRFRDNKKKRREYWMDYTDFYFRKDPRYNAGIHGHFGAIFLKSPHEVDYNNSAAGEDQTWIRRKSLNETVRETCNRYLNIKNNTSNKEYFPTFYDE